MGVILNEIVTLSNGLSVTNPYASIAENDTRVFKRVDASTNTISYITKGRFTMWVSKDIRDNGGEDIGHILVENISETPPTVNVYETLYNKIKTMKNCTDAM